MSLTILAYLSALMLLKPVITQAWIETASRVCSSSPLKPSDADFLSNRGCGFLDEGGHCFGGVLDESLLQKSLLSQELLNTPVYNLASAWQQA